MRLDSQHHREIAGGRRLRTAPGLAGGGRAETGTTFIEVLISVVIVALVFGTIINGYLAGAKRAQWSGYALAAQSLSVQCLEQARSAVWDIAINKNELTNMTLQAKSYNAATATWTGYTTNILDVPWKGNNYLTATNFISIQDIFANNYSNVPVHLMVIRVDTVWAFNGWGNFAISYYTNSICTYMAPDNRDPSSLGGG